jgi:putative membrane protein
MPESAQEPDYRFTLANERTFLAWIRTSLALIAGGVGLMQLVPSFGLIPGVKHGLSVALAVSGGVLSAVAVRRWQKVQDAMRRQTELPPSRMPVGLGVALLLITGVLIALMIFEPHPG